MEKYLSHYSAASFWEIPCLDVAAKNLYEETGDKKHYTFTDRKRISHKKGIIPHYCGLAHPPRAIIVKNEVAVASPELVFLQLADQLSLHQLILLGLQICSHPPGKASEALSNKRKLRNFVTNFERHTGRPKALRALKYVENGSASIMESLVYMILCLPNFMGGYGLGKAVFNHEIKLKTDLAKRLSQKSCFIDLYFKKGSFGVEYDSFEWHNSPSGLGKDALRAGILQRQGVEIFSLSTIQLYDEDACKDFALNLAESMGIRIRFRAEEFAPMHKKLRNLLP